MPISIILFDNVLISVKTSIKCGFNVVVRFTWINIVADEKHVFSGQLHEILGLDRFLDVAKAVGPALLVTELDVRLYECLERAALLSEIL